MGAATMENAQYTSDPNQSSDHYLKEHGFCLTPCKQGTKVSLFKWAGAGGGSKNPSEWGAWRAKGWNPAIIASHSGILTLDIDASKVGKQLAWGAFVKLVGTFGVPEPRELHDPLMPQTISARDGWHCYVRVPEGITPADLRGVGTLVRVSDVRPLTDEEKAADEDPEVIGFKNRGYSLAPGSYYNGAPNGEASGWYTLIPGAAPPHECPPALIELLRRRAVLITPKGVGESDPVDLCNLMTFLAEHDEFVDYDQWVRAGMACKLAAGDDGLEAWQCTHDGSVTNDVETTKWNSFAYEPKPGCVTIGTFIMRARQLGWRGGVRRTINAMFGDVEERKATMKPRLATSDGERVALPGDLFSGDDEPPRRAEAEAEAKPEPLPVIKIAAGKLHDLATAGEKALIAAEVPIYIFADELQRPIIEDVEATRGRKTSTARFVPMGVDGLRDHLCRVARWQKYTKADGFVPADPPRDVAATILSRIGEWKFPRASGVITTPTMRPDGTILSQAGYDPATRLILLNPPALPDIPEAPTKAEALVALQKLDDLLAEFPFVDGASRSVALSELITPVVRGAMPVAPLHANRAPTPGSGKSYVLDISSAIASGQPCPVFSAGADEFETEKRLGAALLKGQPLISIDNLNGELRGDALCQMIERPIVEVRVLGLSKLVRIESKATLFATGNNIVLAGDIVRRVLLCTLDANLERPELRQFKSRPFETVMANRGTYIAAALTVVRAYLAAGCPGALPALASFEDWSRLVRSALVWLGRADPVATMEAARAEDPELDSLRRVVAALLGAVGTDKPHTAGQLKELAEHVTIGDFKPTHPTLRDAFMSVAGAAGKMIDTKRLGMWLGQRRGRIVDGHKLMSQDDSHTKQALWYVTRATRA
jgi:putative DNA primase/helicase